MVEDREEKGGDVGNGNKDERKYEGYGMGVIKVKKYGTECERK